MLKQRPTEIHHNLRKLCGDYRIFSPQTQGKNMLFFLKPSQGSIPLYIKKQKAPYWVPLFFGADEGNRTPVISLGSFYSTIELHLQKQCLH